MNREVLAKSLVAACDIPAGTEITETMVQIKSPGQGLQPNRLNDLIGSQLSVSKTKGDVFFPSDLEAPVAAPSKIQIQSTFWATRSIPRHKSIFRSEQPRSS